MPVKAGPKRDRAYLRATARAVKEHAALLAEAGPPPAGAAPPLSAGEKAERLRRVGAAAYLCGAAAPVLGEAMDIEAWQVYLDDLLKRMGVTGAADPVARMMAEQLALAHDAVGRLHLRAGTRTSPAEVAAYHAAVGRLMTEFRRTAAALKTYGAAAASRGAAPRTRTRPPEGGRPARRAKKAQRGKVGSNNRMRGRVRGRQHACA